MLHATHQPKRFFVGMPAGGLSTGQTDHDDAAARSRQATGRASERTDAERQAAWDRLPQRRQPTER